MTASTTDRQALEAFLLDNPELEQLEALADQFNIFEVIGAVRQELRHSDFLAFLLDPQQPHGLGDLFVKRLLQHVVANAEDADLPITPIDLALWDLDQLEVRREWRNIDILLLDETHQFAVVIENKVGSGEHGDQLKRYWRTVRRHYRDRRRVGIFLTPDGTPASHDNYLPLDYGVVADQIDELVETRSSTLGPDVRTSMIHYTQMLRRHVVSESEIAQLCRRIYRKHKRALNLIYEHRPDLQAQVQECLESLIAETPGVSRDDSIKTRVRFIVDEWDVPALRVAEGWTSSDHILLFQFANHSNRVPLRLTIGPGPEDVRQRLFDMANKQNLFLNVGTPANKQSIYAYSVLTTNDYEEADQEELESKIETRWRQFLNDDFQRIREILRREEWIWEQHD